MEDLQSMMNIQEKDLEVQQLISNGFSGEIFKGIWRTEDGEEVVVAIKKMKVIDKEVVAESSREFKRMRNTPFENLCRVYGGCIANNNEEVWLVMEHVDGGDLHNFLKNHAGNMPIDIQLSFFIQATKAVAYLHHPPTAATPPFLHRDIKSQNFLVQNNCKLLLTDFGLSKAKTYLNSTTFTLDSVRWAAPEIVTTAKPSWSDKSDIYSLGMVFYEIVTQTLPYHEDSNLGNILQKIKAGTKPKTPPDCPKELWEIIHNCLRKKPSKRPTAMDLLVQLKKLLQPQIKAKHDLRSSLKKSMSVEYKEYRIVLVGAANVGKSALAARFVSGTFVQKYDPTIEENYRKQMDIDGRHCLFEITDTAGQDEYADLRDTCISSGDGFVLVYSVTDAASFEKVVKLRDTILQITGHPDIPMILVANKSQKDSTRAVAKKEGRKTADKWGIGFIKASAKTPKNVSEIFVGLVKQIEKWRLNNSHQVHIVRQQLSPPSCTLL